MKRRDFLGLTNHQFSEVTSAALGQSFRDRYDGEVIATSITNWISQCSIFNTRFNDSPSPIANQKSQMESTLPHLHPPIHLSLYPFIPLSIHKGS
jgi:hypothetical protein